MKTCNRCGLAKPESAFEKHRGVCYRCRLGKAPKPHPAVVQGPAGPKMKEVKPPKVFVRDVPKAERYIITAAQNATPAHGAFLETLKVAAAHLGAELIIIPLRYKNPTSIWSQKQDDDDWWDEAVVPFLFDGRIHLHKHLVLVADVKSQPTAVRPLSGFEAMTGADSAIIGHPKMEFVTVPVPSGRFPKILSTTGAVTERNYSDTRAGKLGEFHHFLGGLLVEIDDNAFHVRQINASREDGSFTDLDLHFAPSGVTQAPRALGLVMGDTHVRVTDWVVDRATFGANGIVETLNPVTLVFHDLIDGQSTNPHDVGDPFLEDIKQRYDATDVQKELSEVVQFVNLRGAGRETVVVDSNHHDFLVRWMRRSDWKGLGPENRRFYLRTALRVLESGEMTERGPEYKDPFPHALRELGLKSDVRCLGADESFKLADIECGLHGHRGPNGARGSLKNLSRLGTKTISGHSHTPGIEEGGYAVGTSTPRSLHYTRGPGSWLNTHCVVYASGKRALITIIDGRWRLERQKEEAKCATP